jgi:hypothetical protein
VPSTTSRPKWSTGGREEAAPCEARRLRVDRIRPRGITGSEGACHGPDHHGEEAVVGRAALAVEEEREPGAEGRERETQERRPRPGEHLGGHEEVCERHEEQHRAQRIEQAEAAARLGRHVYELVATHPEDHRRDEHQDARHAEGHARAIGALEPGDEQRGAEGAEVDAEVEDLEDRAYAEPIVGAELIADVGRDAGFDAAGAERDEPEPDVHAEQGVVGDREHGVPRAVDERQAEDDAVLAEETVGEHRAEHRHEVHAGLEEVHVAGGEIVGALLHLASEHVQRREVHEEDRAHPVEAEALAGLVAHDVRHARWPTRGLVIRRRSSCAHPATATRHGPRGQVPRPEAGAIESLTRHAAQALASPP